jgi:hypothetical protein
MNDDHAANLRRVADAIGASVVAFVEARLRLGVPEFTMTDLHQYVAAHHTTAPDSAGRILRDLKQRGRVNYVLVSRRQSRYRALAVVT